MELNELLERSEALLIGEQGRQEREGIPKLRRNLQQIEGDAVRIFSARRSSGRSAISEAKAVRLLAEYGFETGDLHRYLKSARLDGIQESHEPAAYDDLPSFLEIKFQETAASVRKEAESTAEQYYEAAFQKLVSEEISVARANLWTSFRQRNQQGHTPALAGSQNRELGILSPGFADAVCSFVEDSQGSAAAETLTTRLLTTVKETGDAYINACYSAVHGFIADISASQQRSPSRLIRAAICFLESQFLDKLDRKYHAGGDVGALVLDYVRDLIGANQHDDLPLWPRVLFTLRCGRTRLALALVNSSDVDSGHFSTFLEAFIENNGVLSEEMLTTLLQEYSLVVQRGHDSFQKACYALLAKLNPVGGPFLDSNDMQTIGTSIEDYLWMMMSCVRYERDEKAAAGEAQSNVLQIGELQEQVRSLGPRYFDSDGRRPFLYVLVLLATLQFREAIRHLSEIGQLLHAVHLGMAVYTESIFSMDFDGSSQDKECDDFDYELFVDEYVGGVAMRHPAEAAYYAFVVRDARKREEMLLKLLVDIKEVGVYLGGKSDIDGEFSPGLFDKLSHCSPQPVTDIHELTRTAARRIASRGDPYTALEMYDLVDAVEAAFDILVPLLSAELFSRSSFGRQQALTESGRFLSKRLDQGLDSDSAEFNLGRKWRTLNALVKLTVFLDLYWNRKDEEAWGALQTAEIFPVTEDQIPSTLRDMAWGGSARFERALTDRGPELLAAALDVLRRLLAKEPPRMSGSGEARAYHSGALEAAGRTLMTFASMMHYDRSEIDTSVSMLGLALSP